MVLQKVQLKNKIRHAVHTMAGQTVPIPVMEPVSQTKARPLPYMETEQQLNNSISFDF